MKLRFLPQVLAASCLAASTANAQSAGAHDAWRNVEIADGGFVSGFITHPARKGLMYARTDIGGAYRWNAPDKRWVALTDWVTQHSWNFSGIESLALDPTSVGFRELPRAGGFLRAAPHAKAQLWLASDGASFSKENNVDVDKATRIGFGKAAPGQLSPIGSANQGVPYADLSTKPTASQTAPRTVFHLEAEDATLSGTAVSTARAGFSGTGYVSGFDQDGDRIEFSIANARAGIYEVKIRYNASSGDKGYDLVVNGSKFSGMLARTGESFATHIVGKVELKQGANTLAIEKSWGYYDIDAIDIAPARIDTSLKKPPKALVDRRATAGARALHSYLVDLYGQKTLSGQHEEADAKYLRDTIGKSPAILGSDLIEYSPSRVANGSKPEGTTERLIQSARKGQIITLAWHWNAPKDLINQEKFEKPNGQTINALWWRGFYTEATTFDVQKALANPQSQDYKLLLRDIDVIARELKKLDAAGVPVLWRPLHEAEGGWFWWGAKGPEPLKKLWRLMFDRLTNQHKLHNLIWVFTGTPNMAWYPGNDVVDIIGVDAYPSDVGDPLGSTWDALKQQFDGKKLLALSEFGGVPDVDKARRYGVRWSYFMSWTSELGPRKMSRQVLERIYKSPAVLNQSDLKLPAAAKVAAARARN